jgi:hypothetical protein
VRLVVDSRAEPPADLAKWLRAQRVEIRAGTHVATALGGRRVERVRLSSGDEVACDALGMSGGWMPAVHLYSHARAPLTYDNASRSFRPEDPRPPLLASGALNGCTSLDAAFADALGAVRRVLEHAGRPEELLVARPTVQEAPLSPATEPIPLAPDGRSDRQWLDFLHDVTVADAEIALQEGYGHIELLKRYTTCGMAVDQGKTSNLNALRTLAELTDVGPAELGTTTFRPPYTPVTLGAIAGRQVGDRYAPRRLLPAHSEHEALGARWWEAGGWMRPACYPKKGETTAQAVLREASAVRAGVGIFDASPLGKIEVTGPDAAKFLDRFYVNSVAKLEEGRVRYGLMLNENGTIIDDGTVARLGREQFLVTTTSGGASRIAAWLEEWRQCEWPDLEAFVTPVTTQWATFAVAGPRARQLLARFRTDIAFDWRSMPHMSMRQGRFAGVPARLYRVSFSGELGYEINVPARYRRLALEPAPESGRRLRRDPLRRRDRAAAAARERLPARRRGHGRNHRARRRRLGRRRRQAQERLHRQAFALAPRQPARRSPPAGRTPGNGRLRPRARRALAALRHDGGQRRLGDFRQPLARARQADRTRVAARRARAPRRAHRRPRPRQDLRGDNRPADLPRSRRQAPACLSPSQASSPSRASRQADASSPTSSSCRCCRRERSCGCSSARARRRRSTPCASRVARCRSR